MPKKAGKALIKELEALGYEYDRTNAKSLWIYVHPDGNEIPLNPGCNDNAAKRILRRARAAHGIEKEDVKRRPEQVKERQAKEREDAAREIARLNAELDEIIRRRDSLLDGAGSALSNRELRALELRVAEIERERQGFERLMTDTPQGGNKHRGTKGPRHQSGDAA